MSGKRVWTTLVRVLLPLTTYLLPLTLVAQSPLARRWDRVSLPHDALHYDIRVVLPASDSVLSAEVATRWRIRGATPLVLDLDSAFSITSASVNGREVRWTRRGHRVTLHTGALPPGEAVTRVAYRGVPPDGLIIRGAGAERTIFSDNWPDRARRWLASQDHPSDKASVAWQIDAPETLTVVANGALEGIVNRPGGRRLWQFRNPEAIPVYSMVLGAARLTMTRLVPAGCMVRCLGVSLFTAAEDSARAVTGGFKQASAMVDFFQEWFGEFPYGELRHVQSTTRYGGMENATAIFYNGARLHEGLIAEATVAHETGHQWFGDAVTEADWHHLWLSEGFATYAGALWAEHVGGDTGLRATMTRAREAILASAATARPVLDSTESDPMKLLNSNAYQKGAWVLHSLRALVGDTVFRRGLRRFVATYRHGTALSADFARVMSQESKTDLTWYFRQSLLQPGYPMLTVGAAVESNHLVVTVTQVQPPAWGVYRLPGLEVRLDDRTLVLDVRSRVTRIASHWGSDRPPASVTVDPAGKWLLVAQAAP